jgi:hypothetical protein
MGVTRDISNANKMVEWTEEINELENQYGFIKSLNLFNTKGTSQTAIIFDKNTHDITLLPQSSRSSRQPTVGKDRKVETFALPLSYFKHADAITPEDIQGIRAPDGGGDTAETLNRVRVEKLTDMRLAADQTDEYMQLQAMKGIMKTPDGAVVANMFTEFGITPFQVDFELGTATTDIDKKILEVKRHIAKNVKTGGAIQGVDFFVDSEFFDKLISHPRFREVYNQYQNSGNQRLRDDLSNYMTWGISDVVEHRGVRFVSYDAEFNMPDGTTEKSFEASTGTAVARGVRDLFRGYNGPSNKLAGANQVGQPMFAYEYTDPKGEFMDLELEMAKLYFCTKPQSIVRLISSN